MSEVRAILIAGPTASGKSAFAIDLAQRVGGVIINADSMQIYRELRILTARPDPTEEAQARHLLFGFRSAADPYSVGQWLEDAAAALEHAEDAGLVPIFTGGTGLYFKALLEGLSPVPEIPEEIRERWRARAAQEDSKTLHRLLAERDPVMASRLRPSDPQRIVRALEVLEATGRSLAEWQAEPGVPFLQEEGVEKFVISPDRAELYRRCEVRAERMLAEGALEEVRQLLDMKLKAELPAMRAIGVQPLAAHLRGELSLDEALARLKLETRRYAKRQLTWARRNMVAWKWIKTK